MSDVVVCPLDGKPRSERALLTARDAAQLLRGRLELFSAVEDPHMLGRREMYLTDLATSDQPGCCPPTTVAVVVDPHAPQALAERSAAPTVTTVMATSTRPLLHDGYVGSAAERVARLASIPTLLVGPNHRTRLRDVQRVVVCCDGSELSETAIPEAQEWAERIGVDLWVVTVLEASINRPQYGTASETHYVRDLSDRVNAQWDVLHGKDPATAITTWAGPALIAMTTRGRSGLARLAFGSVTTAVTRHANGPVLAVRPR